MNPYRAASVPTRRLLTRVREQSDWFLLVFLFAGGARVALAWWQGEPWDWELGVILAFAVISGLLWWICRWTR